MKIAIHEDSLYSLDYHFKNKKSNMRPLFEELINKLSHEMKLKLKIGKAYIGLVNKLVFAAIHIQIKKIIFEFTARQKVSSPRIIKSLKFQKARWAYYVELKDPADIDKELLNWARLSYENK